ncbi:MAG TPA: hypothetical protein VML75_15215 [Kofleriaceae bacterium]|nr:hypothetical protein [Kofleriaceae bacterium]
MVLVLVSSVGCGSGDGGPNGGDPDGAVGDTPDAATAGFTRLLETPWTLPAGSEIYLCTRWTAPRDMFVNEFSPVIPYGTHHTVVTVESGSSQPDGSRECSNPFEGGPRQIYGTGAGSVPVKYPDGVAIKIAQGQQVVLNLHLFNVSDSELSGTSAIDVKEVPQNEVVNEAQSELVGKVLGLTVAPGTSTQSATCTVQSNLNVFLVQPHMHQLGVHLKGTLIPAGGGADIVLFDDAYDFDAQVHVLLDPIQPLAAGDQLTVTCTYDNTTGQTVTFGESSDDEMCFLGLAVYPSNQTLCTTF